MVGKNSFLILLVGISALIYGRHFLRYGHFFMKTKFGLLEMVLVLVVGKTLRFQQKLHTNLKRARWGISRNNSCTLRGHDFEDLAHVHRDYPYAKDVWMLVVPDQLKQRFFSVSFQDWLILNLCFHERLQGSGLTWSCMFGLIAWRIWKNKNLFIFQHISWAATEVVYLSTDGAVVRDSGYAATGSVARDHDRNWIVGFTRFLGVCSPSPFKAEVWGILDGILILLNKGYSRRLEFD
ncbi:hypothetical protein Goklo_012619 [Gossypium klotzschianum]|uniref:RNase H type-1 domain-containing protein n=1 Tax=Gossypium klotzschianum TaxID=34286 RepID=A0A7J8VCX6_9ROSI|nr:hypothetical protein [Gossypium klotzschianum]